MVITSTTSSMTLLQLSSMPLNTSTAFGRMAASASLQSPAQVVYPSLSWSKPSSTLVSQSSSTPLQVSVVGVPATALQVVVLAEEQTIIPVRKQPPMPALQATPVPNPSSMVPSQSSSLA